MQISAGRTDGDGTRLVALVERQDADGKRMFSHDDVMHYLPLLMLKSGVDFDKLEREDLEVFGRLSVAAGVTDEMDSEAVTNAIDRYYEQNPPNPALVAAVDRLLKTIAADDSSTASNAMARLLGSTTSNRPVGGAPSPAGGFKGGLLARFHAGDALGADK